MILNQRNLIIAIVGFASSVAALAMAALAIVGYRSGELHFVTALTDFERSAYIAGVALFLSLVGFWMARLSGVRRDLFLSLSGMVLSLPLVVFIVNFEYAAKVYPPINDITTDTEDPPTFWDVPNPVTYPGDKVAELQRQAYPHIKPLEVNMEPADTFKLASDVARDMGWKIVAENSSDMQIEAIATSILFGFEDYVGIRLQDDNGHTRVDVRSHSRLGRIDRGVNAKRILTYLNALQQRVVME